MSSTSSRSIPASDRLVNTPHNQLNPMLSPLPNTNARDTITTRPPLVLAVERARVLSLTDCCAQLAITMAYKPIEATETR
ncbi:hypothetical protein [Nocardia sp. NPDC049149]|uniref:hypothetical protein n=1 Tax=Nocardia sp. NPDC049149 TaxID=3364315 RepID=UPI00371AB689